MEPTRIGSRRQEDDHSGALDVRIVCFPDPVANHPTIGRVAIDNTGPFHLQTIQFGIQRAWVHCEMEFSIELRIESGWRLPVGPL